MPRRCGKPTDCPHAERMPCAREAAHDGGCAPPCDLCVAALLAEARDAAAPPGPGAQHEGPLSDAGLLKLERSARQQRSVPVRGVLRLIERSRIKEEQLRRAEAAIAGALAIGDTVACLPGHEASDMRRVLTRYPLPTGASGGATPPARGE